MIKIISKVGKKTNCKMRGSRFDVANEAINVSVTLVNAISDVDAVLGDLVRRKIVDALEGRAKPIGEQKEETEAE
jgi:hypothetical protein